ncbi:MAG: antibiotic biosynthesis monooxygenase family protein [Bacteroidota bacterium]
MYVVIWEFLAKTGLEAEFERAYGPEGVWVSLFRTDEGYLGTELLHSLDGIYLTVDRWSSREAYENFKDRNRSEYDAIDRRCAHLTERERELGTFFRVER